MKMVYIWKDGSSHSVEGGDREARGRLAELVAQKGKPVRSEYVMRHPHLWEIDPESIGARNPYEGMDGYTGWCNRCGESHSLTEEDVSEIVDLRNAIRGKMMKCTWKDGAYVVGTEEDSEFRRGFDELVAQKGDPVEVKWVDEPPVVTRKSGPAGPVPGLDEL